VVGGHDDERVLCLTCTLQGVQDPAYVLIQQPYGALEVGEVLLGGQLGVDEGWDGDSLGDVRLGAETMGQPMRLDRADLEEEGLGLAPTVLQELAHDVGDVPGAAARQHLVHAEHLP